MFPLSGILAHHEFLLTWQNTHDLILVVEKNMIPIEFICEGCRDKQQKLIFPLF